MNMVVGRIEIQIGNLPGGAAWHIVDHLMVAMDEHPGMVGPMVSANQATRTLDVSFEFAAIGHAAVDIPKALGFFGEAMANAAAMAQEMAEGAQSGGWPEQSVRLEYAGV